MTDFSLSGITMVNCELDGVNRGFRHGYLSLSYFTLHIALGVNVNLSFLFITNSTQFVLLCFTSGIQDSVITHSNYRLLEKYMQGKVECSVDVWKFHGSCVCVVFVNSRVNVASNIAPHL